MEFLPFEMDYLTDELIEKAEKELGETSESRERTLIELKKLLDEEKNISYSKQDRHLLLHLRPRKFDVKRTVAGIKGYFHIKQKYEDYFGILDYDSVVKVCREEMVLFLPKRDADGCVVVVIQARLWNPREMNVATLVHSATCVALIFVDRHVATQICGVKVIIDIKGTSYNQLLHLSPRLLFLGGCSECFPVRIKGIHIFNESIFIKYVWNLVKLIISEKLRKRVHFHSSNMESLHNKFNPVLLPACLGGTAVCDIESVVKAVESNRENYYEHIQYGYTKPQKT